MISFGLLLLLGVSGNQNEQIAITANEPDRIIMLDTPSGIIPEVSTELPQPFFSRWILPGEGSLSLHTENEYITANIVRTRLHFFNERYREYIPGLAEKKGMRLILPAHEGDQSRA